MYKLYDYENDDLIYKGDSKQELRKAYKEYSEACEGHWIPQCVCIEKIGMKAREIENACMFYVRNENKELLYKGDNLDKAKQIAKETKAVYGRHRRQSILFAVRPVTDGSILQKEDSSQMPIEWPCVSRTPWHGHRNL